MKEKNITVECIGSFNIGDGRKYKPGDYMTLPREQAAGYVKAKTAKYLVKEEPEPEVKPEPKTKRESKPTEVKSDGK